MVVIVSALSVRELFLSETETSHRNLTQTRKQWSGQVRILLLLYYQLFFLLLGGGASPRRPHGVAKGCSRLREGLR